MGLAQDATIFLETATSFFNGDPITGKWSIGGYSPKVSTLGPLQESLLGKPAGICGLGHLRSEGDASITRGDFSQPSGPNNNCESYPQFAKELLDLAREKYPEDGRITPSILAEHQHRRKLYSIANNPNYFSPPYAGVAFTPAAHHFVFALMANKSEEYPQGYLSPENFLTWFGYQGDPQGEITYTVSYLFSQKKEKEKTGNRTNLHPSHSTVMNVFQLHSIEDTHCNNGRWKISWSVLVNRS